MSSEDQVAPDNRITPDNLLDAMSEADVLHVFCRLPESSQQEFREWIGKARDVESHWRRIDALVLALRSGLLNDSASLGGDKAHSKVAE